MENIDILKNAIDEYEGLDVEDIVSKLIEYKDLLLEWNKVMNLTSIEDEREIYIKHFLDSISILETKLISENAKIIDVGTGAGFPGIPLKIARPDVRLTLLDSLNKRIGFLKAVGEDLGLDGIEYLHSRAEDAAKKEGYRESYDIATARAVANMPVLMEYCVPYVRVGGYFICLKGPQAADEVRDASNAAKILGVELVDVFHVKLFDESLKHTIVVYRKVKSTPKKYPRKAGTPTKNPL